MAAGEVETEAGASESRGMVFYWGNFIIRVADWTMISCRLPEPFDSQSETLGDTKFSNF